MKRWIAFTLVLVLACPLFAGCKNEKTPQSTKPAAAQPQPTPDDGVLRVLLLGHSLGNDSSWLVPAVAKNQGIDNMVFGMLYHSGCRLRQHVEYSVSNAKEYDYRQFDLSKDNTWQIADSQGAFYNGGTADSTDNLDTQVTMKFAIEQQDWDIVVLQGGVFEQAGDSSDGKLDVGHIQLIMNYVLDNDIDKTTVPKFAWNQTWGIPMDLELTKETYRNHLLSTWNDSQHLFESICATLQNKIAAEYDFEYIFPTGTAFWNARSSYLGDKGMYRDYAHATDFGRVVAAYTWLCVLTEKTMEDMKIETIPGYQLKKYLPSGLTLTEAEKGILIEAVNNALKKPYELTPSTYTETPPQ